jgi:hypothetical protein
MRRYRTIAPYLLPLVCVAALLCIAAQKKESGSDPYTPTKLEWLTMEANIRSDDDPLGKGYSIYAVPQSPDTILFVVNVAPWFNGANGQQELMKFDVSGRAMAAREFARIRGWHNWLKVEQKIVDTREAMENVPQ